MKIIIGEETRESMSFFSINDYPFSEHELRAKYMSLIKTHHPDQNKEPDAEKKTKKIIATYQKLKNLVIPEVTETKAQKVKETYELEKEDIFSFWEDCPTCNITGKIVRNHGDSAKPIYTIKTCPDCNGVGKYKTHVFNPVIPKGSVLKS